MHQEALGRRRVWVGAVVALLVLILVMPNGSQAQDDTIVFPNGQQLSNEQGFLSFWREHNGQQMLGAAISRPVEENGLTVQYFERGRLEQHTEIDSSPIMLGRIGADYAAALWRTFDLPAPDAVDSSDVQHFAETGYTLGEPFKSFWQANGGVAMLGLPISEPLWEYVGNQMLEVQYFERARLERWAHTDGSPDTVAISALGRDVALLRNIDLSASSAPADPSVAVNQSNAPAAVPVVVDQSVSPQLAPTVVKQVATEVAKLAPAPPVVRQSAPQPARTGRGGAKLHCGGFEQAASMGV